MRALERARSEATPFILPLGGLDLLEQHPCSKNHIGCDEGPASIGKEYDPEEGQDTDDRKDHRCEEGDLCRRRQVHVWLLVQAGERRLVVAGRAARVLRLISFAPYSEEDLFRASLSFLAGTNVSFVVAGKVMVVPVAGLRPMRSGTRFVLNLPKPGIDVSAPAVDAATIAANTASTIAFASARGRW